MRPRGPQLLLVLSFALLVAVCYRPMFGAAFIADDYPDLVYIANAGLGDLLADGLWGLTGGAGRYRPVLHLSAKIDWLLWGTNPLGYLLTQLALHVASAWLLAALLSRVATRFVAVAAALLWLVHPLHPEAVSWFASRGNLLAVFFSLLALLLFVRERQAAVRSWRRLAAAWLAAFAAHLSHETVLLLPFVIATADAAALDPPPDRRVFRAVQSLVFFGSALAMCLVLRTLVLEAALGGELLDVVAQVPEGERLPLLWHSLVERARLVLAPVHPEAVTGTYRDILGVLVLVLLVVSTGLARDRVRIGPALALLVAAGALYLPSAFVVIDADRFTNTRMFYTLLLPVLPAFAFAVAAWPPFVRAAAIGLLAVGYAWSAHAVCERRADAAEQCERWAAAAAAGVTPETRKMFLLEPPLMRGGTLVLENAVGSLLVPPFHPARVEAHPMTNDTLLALAVVPEARALRGPPVRIVSVRGGESRAVTLPAERRVEPRSWDGNEADVEMTALDVTALRASGTGLLVLGWKARDGATGEVPGWPLPAGGGVLFPVASHPEWLLAGTITAIEIRGGDAGTVRALDRLPALAVTSPDDGVELSRGDPPPVFRGEVLGAGPGRRVAFFTWPGPFVLRVPLGGERLELAPEVAPSLSGAFAWSVFENAFLFAPSLERLYWCFEESDPLGRAVARSALRRLMPRRP